MKQPSRLLTLDANVLIAALKADEPYSKKCGEILTKIPNNFQLAEPSIIYLEVCGNLARKASLEIADEAKKQMDLMINPKLLNSCDKNLCTSAYCLCMEYDIYTIDALYLQVAIKNGAILVSIDKEDFVDRLKKKKLPIEVYSVPEFPY